MEKSIIYNESCFDTMNNRGVIKEHAVDVILTSPPYNTSKHFNAKSTISDVGYKERHGVKYDTPMDNMTTEEYCEFTVNLFQNFENILKQNGVILYNLSYGSENTDGMFLAISDVIRNTMFTVADVIVWKKKCAVPNNVSRNKLTRIWEFVFVIAKKDELNTYHSNKEAIGIRSNGQTIFANTFNFIEAKNNDGVCPYNFATYSTELCEKLLKLYAPKNAVVYDPFMGSGTTAVACEMLNLKCFGSEISKNQCEFAEKRLKQFRDFGVTGISTDDIRSISISKKLF